MARDWRAALAHDPVAPLLSVPNPSIVFFARRDLCRESRLDVRTLWELEGAARLLRRQAPDGSWQFASNMPGVDYGEDYTQLETFRRMGQLIEVFGLDRSHPALERAAEYLFGCQTSEGDFRGIYGRQYATTYTGAIAELLVKAGYAEDPRLEKCFEWLLYMRQEDGGWAIPLRTVGLELRHSMGKGRVAEPDRSKPFSHLVTGMVLRAFAAHPVWRRSEAALRAGHLLASRFFERDRYADRSSAAHWESTSFPFWFTDIVSALDSLTRIGIRATDRPGTDSSVHSPHLGQGTQSPPGRMAEGLEWLRSRQLADGLFAINLLKNRSLPDLPAWVSLAVCRVFARVAGGRAQRPACLAPAAATSRKRPAFTS